MASDAKDDGADNDENGGLTKTLDEGLKLYYLKHNRPYDSLLANWFDENEFDDETLKEELLMEVDDSSLPDFLDETDNFPFDSSVSDDMKREEFIKILRQIRDDPECFTIPRLDGDLFKSVTQKDITRMKEQYEEQVPILTARHMLTDYTLLTILAVGHKRGFNYLGHLSDAYTRERVKHMVNSKQFSPELTVKQWASPQSNRHFKRLADLEVEMFSAKSNSIPYHELVSSAISSYQKRICKRLDLVQPIKINNSIEFVVEHFSAACQFVRGRLSKFKAQPNPCCPFQLDICIAVGAPLPAEEESDDDEDDDDEDDDDDQKKDPDEFIDYIGDIESKLKANKLKYEAFEVGAGDDGTLSRARVFRDGYKNLMGTDRDDEQFLRHQRFISLVDRRNREKLTEKAFVYKPPNTHPSGGNPLDIPHDAVNEWFMASSAMTILPDIHYSTEKEVPPSESHPATEVNIGTTSGIAGGLLTLSIHVLEEDVVRAYLHWNGRTMRFMPEDIRDVFPFIFNMEFKGNKEFMLEEGLHRNINEMKRTLKDREFETFLKKY